MSVCGGADHFQNDLADALGLHPKVLSRKLNGYENAHLTAQEVWKIIGTLIQWKAITAQDEVLELLELAQIEPDTFSTEEWQALSINQGQVEVRSIPTSPITHVYTHFDKICPPRSLHLSDVKKW